MAKRLVVCCDGTWNAANQKYRTNVSKVARAVLPASADGTEQRVGYLNGVGTKWTEKLPGGAFGWGLSGKVREAYCFLVENFEPGDELFLFGFSRGAYTVRSLAGLVRNSGILRLEHENRLAQAWDLYRDRGKKPAEQVSKDFRKDYSHETKIRFIGVWDTVGALGIPIPGPHVLWPLVKWVNSHWAFHDTELSSWVEGAFHAVAIDEERQAFQPALWHQQPGVGPEEQELSQVWFSGVHCDIGGGYQDTALSDLSLLWTVDKAVRFGLALDTAALGTGPLRPLGEIHDSFNGLFRLAPRLNRPIGQARATKDGPLDGHECVAETARLRYRTPPDPGYDPPGLKNYLNAKGKVCIAPVPGPPVPPPPTTPLLMVRPSVPEPPARQPS
jgi:uncharacterized protein (DUF2235 family)